MAEECMHGKMMQVQDGWGGGVADGEVGN